MIQCLNGSWWFGPDRRYDGVVTVPGLVGDPERPSPGKVWLKRTVERPEGFGAATLLLKGARFAPEVYVDGRCQSAAEGGMAPTRHWLDLSGTGDRFELEIALCPLDDLDPADASKIPPADHWRSNLSSCVWDDVMLRFHGAARIERLYAYTDTDGSVRARARTGGAAADSEIRFRVEDAEGNAVLRHSVACDGGGETDALLPGGEALEEWSPERPVCYRLRAELRADGVVADADSATLARRRFEVRGKRFALNGRTVTLRAGSVVWHRWLRDPEAPELAWDMDWLTENVLLRLKRMGANTLRFHLGMPPERVLDACDRLGLMVQAEWIFFHGCDASRESMERQWADWFELCFRHPSVCLLHPWNETAGVAGGGVGGDRDGRGKPSPGRPQPPGRAAFAPLLVESVRKRGALLRERGGFREAGHGG